MALKKRSREIQKHDDAPEIFNGCKFWKLMECQTTFKTFPQSCGTCDGCKYHKHESLVSRALAEAQSAACTLFVTLTYADDEKGEWLDYHDVELFLMRLRKAGYKFRKLSAGEYGTTGGRAHWHLLLYFEWSQQHLSQWKREQIETTAFGSPTSENKQAERVRDWPQFAPAMHIGQIPDKREFMSALADPETLWVQTVGYKQSGNYPQKWKFWTHGNVEAQLVSAPGVGTVEEQNRAVRYVCKYATKDPWKDGKKRHLPFEELPEHIKQATAYGPWDLDGTNERTKWVRGNKYVQELENQLLTEFNSDDDVPLHRRIKKHKYNIKCKGGLGRDYFEALGAWYARQIGAQETLATRVFKLGPSYRKKHIEGLRKQLIAGKLPQTQKRNQFYMGDTAFRQFGNGFNQYLKEQNRDQTTGPKFIFDTLETQAKRASDVSSGQMGLLLWEKDTGNSKADLKRRETLENIWGDLPEDRLRGLVPKRLQRLLEDTSQNKGWQNKRKRRLEYEKYGKPKTVSELGGYRIIETTQKRWFFEKDLEPQNRWQIESEKRVFKNPQTGGYEGYSRTTRNFNKRSLWYRREILTAEQLKHALAGTLAPENARAVRIEKEGRGDQTPLASLDIRTVRNRIKKQPEIPF